MHMPPVPRDILRNTSSAPIYGLTAANNDDRRGDDEHSQEA